jgi:hypothetical protein
MSEELDAGIAGLETPNEEAVQVESSEPELKSHPAYDKLLSELPTAWHDKVIPHLQEQDRNFQQQLEKYTPYKEYVDNGVDPAYIEQSIQIAQAIAEDPVGIHQNLTRALMQQGLLQEDAEDAAEDMMSEFADNLSEDQLPESFRRELAERDEKLNSLEEYIQNQELERETAVEYQAIEAEFAGIRDVYEVSDAQEQAIIELMESALVRGQDMTVVQAAKKLVELTGTGFKRVGPVDLSGEAPIVVGKGGNGVPFESISVPKDDRGKKDMLAEMFKQQFGNQ